MRTPSNQNDGPAYNVMRVEWFLAQAELDAIRASDEDDDCDR